MLRIFTFLRNAFERPPEREGRELRFARKRDDGRTPPSGASNGRSEERREPPPLEGTSFPVDNIHIGDAGHEGDLPPDADVRDFAERLESGEEAPVTEDGERTSTLPESGMEDIKKRAQTLKDRMGDIIRWLDDGELQKQFDILRRKKPEFATFIDAVQQNKGAYQKILAPGEGTDEETADARSYHDFLENCTAGPLRGNPEELQDVRNKLKVFEDIVNPEWEYLAELIPQLRGLRDEDSDAEEGRGVITLWTLWSLGLAAMKMWEAAEKARKEKQDREATTFAYNLAKNIGMGKWNSEAFYVLQRDMYTAEEDIISKTTKQYKDMEFHELIAFEGRHLKIREPKYMNAAILRAAAEQGFLYEMDDSDRKIYGTPLQNLVPSTWDTAKINAEFESLKAMQKQGKAKQETEAEGEINGYRQDGVGLYEVEQAVKNKKYWKAVRIIKWIALSRVGSPHGATASATTILQLLISNPEFARYCPPELIKDVGGIGEAGIPEANIHFLKNNDLNIKEMCQQADVSMSTQERERVLWEKFATLDVTPTLMNYLRKTLVGPDGRPQITAEAVYGKADLKKLRDRGAHITDTMIIAQAIGRILEGHPVRKTDGQWIWIYDESNTLFVRYREATKGSIGTLDTHTTWEKYDPGHFSHFNTGKMLAFGKIQSLFEYSRSTRSLTANRSDTPRLSVYIASIANHDIQCRKLVEEQGLPRTYLDAFRASVGDLLRTGVAKIDADGGAHVLPQLISDVNLALRNEKFFGLREDMPEWMQRILEEPSHRAGRATL